MDQYVPETTHRVQTAFRLEESLLRRLKRKAREQNKSLNSYVEALLLSDVRDMPEFPEAAFPVAHAPRVAQMLDILTSNVRHSVFRPLFPKSRGLRIFVSVNPSFAK